MNSISMDAPTSNDHYNAVDGNQLLIPPLIERPQQLETHSKLSTDGPKLHLDWAGC